ncbi:MAG: hypothetical protein DRQ88_00970 [Epsilonproteobacteria bacterium]|nr:MAG: hypothetical protein DRQ89_05035 [Campylobacterota bacterium]RLA67865.1 MAG: hypothetical protein DRQ88_00970 [Campylobacterota bacterium]
MVKREIALLTLMTGILLILSGVLIKHRMDLRKVDRIVRKKIAYESFLNASIKIRDIWSEGDFKGLIAKEKLQCVKEFGKNKSIDPTFYRCNPDFLNCFIKKFKDKFGAQISILPFSSAKFVSVLSGASTTGVLVNLGVGEFNFPLILKDFCHETILPQRIYAHGPYQKGNIDWRWDNFNRLILIDRHLVTKRDYLEWKNLEKEPQNVSEDLSMPITDLIAEEMADFCAFKGKQVATSLVFDAATFYPGDLKKPKPFKNFRSSYPWSRQRIDAFLYSAKRYSDFTFKKEYCLKAYTQECLKLSSYSTFQFKSNSWIGLSNVLGGKMQYMRNPITPSKNLWVSSFYFPVASDSHRLGFRESWDESAFEPINLNLLVRPIKEPKTYEIGFRCMRYLPNAK